MGGIVMAATISANSAGGGGLVSSGDASGATSNSGSVTIDSGNGIIIIWFINPKLF